MELSEIETTEPSNFRMTIVEDQDEFAETLKFMEHVIAGLLKPAKAIPSVYYYDDRGSGT